jgi:hypothetical protein
MDELGAKSAGSVTGISIASAFTATSKLVVANAIEGTTDPI